MTHPNESLAGVTDSSTSSASPQSTEMNGVQDSPSLASGLALKRWETAAVTKVNSTNTDTVLIVSQVPNHWLLLQFSNSLRFPFGFYVVQKDSKLFL